MNFANLFGWSRAALIGLVFRLAMGALLGSSVLLAQDAAQPTPAQLVPTEVTPAAVPVDLMVQNPPVVTKVEAHAGQPYGIGKVSFRLQPGDEMVDRTGAVLLTERDRRIFYPVISRTAFRTFIQNVTGKRSGDPEEIHNIWFLFKGEEPLELTLSGTGDVTFPVPIEFSRKRQYNRFVKQWWQAFTKSVADQIESGDYPPIVETYLNSVIGKQLGMQVPDRFAKRRDPLTQTFDLLFNVESIRLETIQNSMLYGVDPSPADQPIPQSIPWTPLIVSDLPANIGIEPLAHCVPEECFYLHFGTWENQIWLQKLLEEFGGDLGRMIKLRGFKYKIQSKFLNQLGIQSNEFDRLFGGNLIDDVAVIGSDTYFNDGSAVGVLLHAKRTEALQKNLLAKRKKFAQTNQEIGVTLETFPMGERSIELMSTPDNRYRSYYVVSGDCHLMTTSRRMAERFLEASDGIGSLGSSDEYRFARYNMPLERDDTVFVYASSRFFQQLLTPHHQIELRRRNSIISDIMLLELSQLGAHNEGLAVTDIPGLIKHGYLPEGFGNRPDAGIFHTVGEHWVDSIRGRRGFFTPIADMEFETVTAEEANWFQARADFFAASIRSLDPMFVALKRYEFQDNVERVMFDARVAPFGEEKYGWLMSMLGPPLQHEIAPMPTDIITLQASMQGGLSNPNVPPHQVFAAVQGELDSEVDLRPTSFLKVLDTLREMPGYIGAWPSPGYTNWMPSLGGAPDEFGYTYSRLLRLWRLQWEGFSVLSFDQARLESLKPHLKVIESQRPAQVRVVVGDLVNSDLNGWANAVNYRRGWQTSIANVRFLNLLTQQFRLSPELARVTAERLLDVELICSLEGDYRLTQLPSGRKLWHSSAWPSFSHPALPENHQAPLMRWFRGLEMEVTKGTNQFSVHGFLDIQRSESTSSLPSFNLFKGFGELFGGNSAENPQLKGQEPAEKPGQE